MTTLDSLHQALKALDPDGVLAGKAYDLTENASLGLSGDPKDFHVGIPYNPWSKQDQTLQSTLGIAFKNVLQEGLKPPNIKSGDKVFIDIAHLRGGWLNFFDSKGDGAESNLAHRIGKLFENIPAESTPIVRFLIGKDGSDNAESVWNGLKEDFHKLFWPGGKCVFDHKKTKVCVGFYGPDFDAKKDPDGVKAEDGSLKTLVKIVRTMVENIKTLAPSETKTVIETALAGFSDDELIKSLNSQVLQCISWNHAKLLVVDGRTLMTGGGNYWNEYADNQRQISDMQCKVKGDAALSAHAYCDYFWDYLNQEHKTDTRSFRRTAELANGDTTGFPSWNATSKIDLFKLENKTRAGGTKKVLSVAKLGDWTGQMKQLRYPIQAIDAIRDAFKDAGVSPAAWSSRIARCKAIQEATTSVYIDAQVFACDFQRGYPAWEKLLNGANGQAGLNQQLHLVGEKAWDGVLWPYDLIAAIAKFLNAVVPSGDIKTKDDAPGLRILLTAHVSRDQRGYGDNIPANELKQRIRCFADPLLLKTDEAYNEWFDGRCVIKRISANDTMFNHNKVYCVDKKLLYVGSDNPYPNYNEEHGVWIDDHDAISAWHDTNFWPRWTSNTAQLADMTPGDKSTMKAFP